MDEVEKNKEELHKRLKEVVDLFNHPDPDIRQKAREYSHQLASEIFAANQYLMNKELQKNSEYDQTMSSHSYASFKDNPYVKEAMKANEIERFYSTDNDEEFDSIDPEPVDELEDLLNEAIKDRRKNARKSHSKLTTSKKR